MSPVWEGGLASKCNPPQKQNADPSTGRRFECNTFETAQIMNSDFGISLWSIILFRVPLAISEWFGIGIVIPLLSN